MSGLIIKLCFLTFFYEPANEWWSKENQIFHRTIEFDGLWIDMNEISNFGTNEDKPHNWPPEQPDWSLKCGNNSLDHPPYPTIHLTTGDNKSGTFSDKSICMIAYNRLGTATDAVEYQQYNTHSLYGWSMAAATKRAVYESTGRRSFVISRATFPGSGRYTGHWLGDNYSRWVDLHRSIIGMFEFNMFGIPYVGADICGFFDPATEEMCARWMSLGAFYPFARNHNNDVQPDQDPALWPNTAEASRVSLGARYTLLPYLYTLFYHAHTEGRSVVRPLVNEFPEDLVARDVDDVLMWGSYLLIAPVLEEGAVTKNTYFPNGLWYDYWTEELAYSTPGYQTLSINITSIGIYIRGGGALPIKKSELNTDLSRKNPFGIIVALDKNSHAAGDIFWDDGISEGTIHSGSYYSANLFFENTTLSLIVEHTLSDLSDELILEYVTLMGFSKNPETVLLNGQSEGVSFEYFETKSLLKIKFSHNMSDNMMLQIVV